MRCNNCNTENEPSAVFCKQCGSRLMQVQNPVPQQQVIQPVQPVQQFQQPTMQVVPPKKSNGLVIGIIAGLSTLVVILFVLVLTSGGNGSNDQLKENGPVSRTLMIYMVGSNLESNSGIASADIASIDPEKIDLNNTNVLLYTGGTKKWFNFVSNNENAIYELKENGFEKVKKYGKENMGDPKTFSEFLTYCYDNYKTDRYDLMFWNHGGAIDGSIYDDFSNDNLSLNDYEKGLKKSPFNQNNKLELIIYRTCLNGTLEIANTLKNYAYYLVASEEVTLGSNLTPVFGFINNINASDTAVDVGKKFIDGYNDAILKLDNMYSESSPILYSLIDLTKINELDNELGKIVENVDVSKHYEDIVKLRSSSLQFAKTFYDDGSYDMVDLKYFVTNLSDILGVSSDKFENVFDDAIVYNISNVDDANGLSIYLPFSGSKDVQSKFVSIYQSLNINKSYKSFLQKFYSMRTSGKTSSFASLSVNEDNTEVEDDKNDGKKFSIKLTDEQVKDYGDSIYIIFKKDDDGKFTPVYSSDNATLKGNVLSTNIKNNLIVVHNKEDNTSSYVTLVDRGYKSNRTLITNVMAYDMDASVKDIKKWMKAAKMSFKINDNGVPEISKLTSIDKNNNGVFAEVINMDEIDYFEFLKSSYKILDENGKYTPNWNNEGVITLFPVYKKDMSFSKASLDDGDYYCVFKLIDVYDNVTYSDLISLN